MKHKTKGKKGNVALKIDISKAFDRINWKYLEVTMRKLGFATHFVDMIMLCVTTVQYNITVNSDIEYIKVQHLYMILIPPAHVLLSFCVE